MTRIGRTEPPSSATASTPAGRDVLGYGLAVLNRLGGAEVIDRLGLRKPVERAVFQATRTGFRTAGAASTRIAAARRARRSAVQGGNPGRAAGAEAAAARPAGAPRSDLFDLTPTDEQRMIVEAVSDFAEREIRPAASASDAACGAPPALLRRAATEFGVAALGVPPELGGAGAERATVTNLLLAETLAHGDLGIAVAMLAPSAVSNALVLWGDAEQQASYLPPFVSDDPPPAALALGEPAVLFDALAPRTTARRDGADWVLDGAKSLVPLAASAELFVVGASTAGGGTALFLLESDTPGVVIEAEPAMGVRAAAMGRLLLDGVRVPASAVLGGESPAERSNAYADCLRLSRLAWVALGVGCAQAVLDYVIPYVNDRQAFGEPISHRQAVAFSVADIAIELEGLRLLSRRAAARAEQGRPFARDVALARALASEYGMKIGSDGVQLLGGHGFVKEHPVERWYRDLRAVGMLEGGVLL